MGRMAESVGTLSDEESNIERLVTELSSLLGVVFRPVGVTWMGNLGHILSLPSDQCLLAVKGPRRGHVVLPVALKGRLEVEEWRPLIASGIFYQLRPEIRRVWSLAVRLVLTLITTTIIFAVLFPVLLPLIGIPLLLSPAVVAPFLLAFVAVLVLPRAYNFHVVRRLRLKADRQVAQIVGTEQFLRVLEKIDTFHIIDLEERKVEKLTMWKRKVSPWPTITERIDNLKRQYS